MKSLGFNPALCSPHLSLTESIAEIMKWTIKKKKEASLHLKHFALKLQQLASVSECLQSGAFWFFFFHFCTMTQLFGNRAVSVLQSGNISRYLVALTSRVFGLAELRSAREAGSANPSTCKCFLCLQGSNFPFSSAKWTASSNLNRCEFLWKCHLNRRCGRSRYECC